ncbi:MAG: YccF domain-containing protein [Hyphomicrobiaceae bacterium]
MSTVSLLLNVLWIVTGGLWMAAGWLLAALIMAITIIGLPWAWAALRIAQYTLLPFGFKVVDRPSGPLAEAAGAVGNLVWFILAGWWLALGHLILAIGLAITIIGIPFAWAHLKLAWLTLWPLGREILPNDVPAMARRNIYDPVVFEPVSYRR